MHGFFSFPDGDCPYPSAACSLGGPSLRTELLGPFMDEGPFQVHLVDLVDGLSAEERLGAERLPSFQVALFYFYGGRIDGGDSPLGETHCDSPLSAARPLRPHTCGPPAGAVVVVVVVVLAAVLRCT